MTTYDTIGTTYSTGRRTEPRIAARIEAALGDARSVLNVGAGTGSYEPAGRAVLAVEPSRVMRAQRDPALLPAIDAVAADLPLDDDSVDAAMAVLTVHHWPDAEAGLRELVRVARRRVVLLTIDAERYAETWLPREYLPELIEVERGTFPTMDELREWLGGGGGVRVEEVPVPTDCIDGFLGAFWSRPEAYLDPAVRAAQSGWHIVGETVSARAVEQLAADLASGAWDRAHGHLRREPEHDLGYRLVVAELPACTS